MTNADIARVRALVVYVGQYAEHLRDCAHWVEQTSEFCTCGYSACGEAYQEALKLLSKEPSGS